MIEFIVNWSTTPENSSSWRSLASSRSDLLRGGGRDEGSTKSLWDNADMDLFCLGWLGRSIPVLKLNCRGFRGDL